ncbi:MAG: aminotransferase class IV, partial [Cyclobacteriaceae bacterium]
MVMDICLSLGIAIYEKNLSLTEFYSADEVFTSGTMGEMTPVKEIDGRKIINEANSAIHAKITEEFKRRIPDHLEKIKS